MNKGSILPLDQNLDRVSEPVLPPLARRFLLFLFLIFSLLLALFTCFQLCVILTIGGFLLLASDAENLVDGALIFFALVALFVIFFLFRLFVLLLLLLLFLAVLHDLSLGLFLLGCRACSELHRSLAGAHRTEPVICTRKLAA